MSGENTKNDHEWVTFVTGDKSEQGENTITIHRVIESGATDEIVGYTDYFQVWRRVINKKREEVYHMTFTVRDLKVTDVYAYKIGEHADEVLSPEQVDSVIREIVSNHDSAEGRKRYQKLVTDAIFERMKEAINDLLEIVDEHNKATALYRTLKS